MRCAFLFTNARCDAAPGAFILSFSFSFSCADCSPFSHMSPSYSSLCHMSWCPPPAFFCDSTPPPSPHSGTPSLPHLGLGRDATSPHVSLWNTPHSTLPFQFIFWFIFLVRLFSFLFLFSLTTPLLSQVHRGPSRLQMRVGAPSFLKSMRTASLLLVRLPLLFFVFPC